jgi:OmcA/MtrC family decaheme c-type cytochrome
MKRHLGSSFSTLRRGLAAASVLALALTGCGGGGGGGGNNNSGGTAPPPATSGVVIEGNPGSAITLPTDPTAIVGKNAVLDMSQTASIENGKLTMHFFLKDEKGNGISLTKNNCQFRAYVSKLTDNTTDQDTGLGWHQVGRESVSFDGDTKLADLGTLHGLLTVIDGSTGEYSYTFADDGYTNNDHPERSYDVGSIAAAMEDPTTEALRATLATSCQYVDKNSKTYLTVNPVNGSYDFSAGTPGTELADSAEIVSSSACFTCHGSSLANADHTIYTEVKTCNQCHALNSYAGNIDPNADLAPMIHSIHYARGGEGTTGPYNTVADFSGVTYPNNPWNCAKCHADGTAVDKATADGEAGPVAAEADLAYSNPTRRACGSCHSDVNFETGENHKGGMQTTDSLCKACHPRSGDITDILFPVKTVHDLGPTGNDPRNQAEFAVNISMDPPANGTDYEAGESPVITVTLTPTDGGATVNYTAAKDVKGTRDGALSNAQLFVYGPRSHAVPVLTACSTTDPDFIAQNGTCGATATQGHQLFVGSDAQVKTDASGFKYQLMDKFADLEPGTYMVRFDGADYGGKSNDDYVTSSVAVINFQVGTATEEPKVSGNGCLNCHGDTHMHLTGQYAHNQPFNTDGCLGCHDYSGNHGDYIGNRVHAIHNETFSGDYSGHVWTEVSFPQQANNCSICHTNSDAAVPVWQSTEPLACGGCHGTDPNAVAAAKTYIADNSITGDQADEITTKAGNEAIAASHMLIMMGFGGGNQKDFFTHGSEPVPGCLVCHGPGQPQDLYQLMGLEKFGIGVDTSQ